MNLKDLIKQIKELGYNDDDAIARVCQDIVLKGIAQSPLSRNVTIKGGVVMRSLTDNVRRATQDIDIDFIRYPLTDEAINSFIKIIDCVDGISIKRIGKIEELSQQDYHGRRTFVIISDENGNSIESKIDLGVHNKLEISQEEYCFDIAFANEGASLLINSKEQMITEKLRSLLKFGTFSTRYKDIFDIYYYCDNINPETFLICMDSLVFDNNEMRENNMVDVYKRISNVFHNAKFKNLVDKSDKRWLDDDIDIVFEKILRFIEEL